MTLSSSRRDGIKWNSELGEVELADFYDFLEDIAGSDRAWVRVQRCKALLNIKTTGTLSLEALLLRVEDRLQEAFLLLSLLSRKRILPYEAHVSFHKENGSEAPKFAEATVRFRQWLGYQLEGDDSSGSWRDLPVLPARLRDGLFVDLLNNYLASPVRQTIGRVIPFLLVSHEEGYFEAKLVTIYTALECLVDDLGRDAGIDHLLGSSAFKKLAKRLREVIRQDVPDEDTANGIETKLPELRRRSFHERLTKLLAIHDVDSRRFWPAGTDVDSEIGKILKRRDGFIHQGNLDDACWGDFMRLQVLLEHWILRILDCPEEALNARVVIRLWVL